MSVGLRVSVGLGAVRVRAGGCVSVGVLDGAGLGTGVSVGLSVWEAVGIACLDVGSAGVDRRDTAGGRW